MTYLPDLCARAEVLVESGGGGRALLGVAGLPGSGKSTLVTELLAALAGRHGPGWVAHLPMDGFHLADAQLDRLGLLDRKGAPETFDVDGYAALLRRVRQGGDRPVYAPGFERDLEQPLAGALVVPPGARLVVTEGNYLLLRDAPWRAARAQLDAVWWVEVDEEQRHTRLIARHEEFGKSPTAAREWVRRVDESNARLIAEGSDQPDLVVRHR